MCATFFVGCRWNQEEKKLCEVLLRFVGVLFRLRRGLYCTLQRTVHNIMCGPGLDRVGALTTTQPSWGNLKKKYSTYSKILHWNDFFSHKITLVLLYCLHIIL